MDQSTFNLYIEIIKNGISSCRYESDTLYFYFLLYKLTKITKVDNDLIRILQAKDEKIGNKIYTNAFKLLSLENELDLNEVELVFNQINQTNKSNIQDYKIERIKILSLLEQSILIAKDNNVNEISSEINKIKKSNINKNPFLVNNLYKSINMTITSENFDRIYDDEVKRLSLLQSYKLKIL